MWRLFFLYTCFYTVASSFVAQARNTPEVIHLLLKTEKEIPVISGWFSQLIPNELLPLELQKQKQYFIKNGQGLFCGVNGTGILFQIKDSAGVMLIKRVDATFYYGDRFWSSNFSYRNKMYSLAGYGFWENRGLLRQYNEASKDWKVIKLNEEHVTSSGFNFWLDTFKGTLYVKPEYKNEAFRQVKGDFPYDTSLVYSLQLDSGSWKVLGTFTGPIKSMVNTPWGLLDFGPYHTILYDFKNNSLLKGRSTLTDKLENAIAGQEQNIFFCIDSMLYFAGPNLETLDSIALTLNDFQFSGTPIYSALEKKDGYIISSVFWGGLLLIIAMSFMIWNFKKSKYKFSLTQKGQNILVGPILEPERDATNPVWKELLTPNEQALVRMLIENDIKGIAVQTDAVNYLLGLSDKKESIQKKNRNDLINSINQKWEAIGKSDIPLIRRERAAFDKRSFFYSIHPDHIAKIKSILD